MAKVKYIPCDIYKRGISVFIGNLDEFKAWVKKDYTDEEEHEFVDMVMGLKEENCGMASFNYDNRNGQGVILIPKYPDSPKERAALAHELLHATFHILNFCHVDYTYDGNNEAFTYLMEHLTRNALELEGYEDVNKELNV